MYRYDTEQRHYCSVDTFARHFTYDGTRYQVTLPNSELHTRTFYYDDEGRHGDEQPESVITGTGCPYRYIFIFVYKAGGRGGDANFCKCGSVHNQNLSVWSVSEMRPPSWPNVSVTAGSETSLTHQFVCNVRITVSDGGFGDSDGNAAIFVCRGPSRFFSECYLYISDFQSPARYNTTSTRTLDDGGCLPVATTTIVNLHEHYFRASSTGSI